MSRKWMAAAALLALMLSVCVFALAEEPTDPVYPVPGPLEKHEHTVSVKIVGRGYTAHRLQEWCPACGRLLKERLESHNFADGVCTVCEWECPHPPEAAEKHYERDGVKPQWDGNYIIGPGWEITECGVCRTVLSRVETTVREFHNVHTHFTPVLECLPHDADTHALIRYCDECGTEVPEYVPHNCPPSDRPYTDEGDPDTHSRLVRCADCGFWVPQQQAHTWVHDSYRKDDTDGGEEGHIEVMKCSVCGAKKEVRQPHGAGTHVAYRQNGNADTHIEVLQCPLCNETFEIEQPHEMIYFSCRNDGDTNTHIDVFKCTLCEAEAGKREAHRPMHLYWKNISDTQDQETVRCNLCGLTYTNAPVAHTFNAYAYTSDGSSSHTKYAACSQCGIRKSTGVKEAHTWCWGEEHWDFCTKCNESKGHRHVKGGGASVKGFRYVDENSHIEIWPCSFCPADIEGNIYAHTFDPATMKCTGCGYLKEGCDHKYSYKPARNGIQEEQHTMIGTCNGCGKQITVTGAHDMQIVSATDFVPNGENHTRTVTERCSVCGYEKQYTEYEEHNYNSGESLGAREHRPVCFVCGVYGAAEKHCFACTFDESAHECPICGETGEHDYSIVEYRHDGDWSGHICVYECSLCKHRKEIAATHIPETFLEPVDAMWHFTVERCTLCGIRVNYPDMHRFDENGACVCGYHKGDSIPETSLPGESLPENTGDTTETLPVFCHMTADGMEIPHNCVFVQLEDDGIYDLILLPESISCDAVIEIRFTAPELEFLQVLGVKNVYIRLSDADLLLLDDVSQALTALAGQERDELVITLTSGSDGACTVQYDPAGICITE